MSDAIIGGMLGTVIVLLVLCIGKIIYDIGRIQGEIDGLKKAKDLISRYSDLGKVKSK